MEIETAERLRTALSGWFYWRQKNNNIWWLPVMSGAEWAGFSTAYAFQDRIQDECQFLFGVTRPSAQNASSRFLRSIWAPLGVETVNSDVQLDMFWSLKLTDSGPRTLGQITFLGLCPLPVDHRPGSTPGRESLYWRHTILASCSELKKKGNYILSQNKNQKIRREAA